MLLGYPFKYCINIFSYEKNAKGTIEIDLKVLSMSKSIPVYPK